MEFLAMATADRTHASKKGAAFFQTKKDYEILSLTNQ